MRQKATSSPTTRIRWMVAVIWHKSTLLHKVRWWIMWACWLRICHLAFSWANQPGGIGMTKPWKNRILPHVSFSRFLPCPTDLLDISQEARIEEEYFEQEQVSVPPPAFFPRGIPLHGAEPSYCFPPIRLYSLHDAIICGRTHFVFTAKGIVSHGMTDLRSTITEEEITARARITPASSRFYWLQRLVPDKSRPRLAKGASFLQSSSFNYAHWVTEVLPRIAVFCMDEKYKDVPLIVDANLHPNIRESLRVVAGPDRNIVELAEGKVICMDQLLVVSPTGHIPHHKRKEDPQPLPPSLFHPHAFREMGRKVLVASSKPTGPANGRKLFIRRNSGIRHIANQGEIESMLVALGFTVVEPEKHGFTEQALLFSQAEILVGATGAAFANLVFCPPTAKVVICMSDHADTRWDFWTNLGGCFGLRMRHVVGKMVDSKANVHGNFHVDANDVLAAIGA